MKKIISHFVISILFSSSVFAQLTNGTLEAGGSGNGFLINNYTQINPLTGVSSPGTYGYTNDPNAMDASFISCGDKTSGSGKMLVYNGATVANKFIWTTSSTGGAIAGFTVGSTYTFSYWIRSVSNDVTNSATRANIGVFFNPGSASNFNPATLSSVAPLPSEGWKQVQYSFTANSTTQLIRLWDINTSALGNDFALDDFSITLGGLPLTISSYTKVNPTCPSTSDGSIVATAAGGNLPYSNYFLSNGTSTVSNTFGIFNNLSAGTYTLSVLDATNATTLPIVINLAPPNDITVSAPITICEGTSTTLSVSGSTSSYLWTANPPDATLTAANNTSTNPIVSPTVNTTYTVTSGVPANATNLIVNGDFSQGDYWFITDYAYPTDPGFASGGGVQGAYGVVNNPQAWFNPFSTCQDHTSGSGKMLVADGSITGTDKIWYTPIAITVVPGKNYTFSYFLANVVTGNPAKLEVLINDVSIGLPATAPSSPCVWEEHSYIWNSGANTTAIISIIDREIVGGGNDFAIDDLNFRETPTCIYQKSVAITVSPNPAPTIGTITQPTCATATGSVVLTGLPTGNWTINPGGITGSTATVTISGLTAGNHTFTVTNANGCVSLASANVGINAVLTIPNPPTIGTITQPTCSTATGSIILLGLPTGNWTINPGGIIGSSASTTISGLTAANYTYIVTNSDGCTSSASANVTINAQPVTPIAPLAIATFQPTCLAMGTIVVSAPLNPNYEYSTGSVFQSGLSFSNLAPSTYLVNVKDVINGCVSLPTSVVLNPIPTVATPTIASIVHPTCVINGLIDIASPIGTNIEYSNGGAYQSNTTFSNLAPNTYIITAKDTSNGCVSAPLTVVINPIPNTLTPLFTAIAPICFGTVINLPILSTNGILGNWLPSFNSSATTTYTFTPNPGQCANATTLEVIITTPATSISVVGSTAFSNNATIIVTTVGGNGSLQYALDDYALQFSNVFTNVNPGTHIIQVTDTNGCTNLSASITIIGYPTYFTPNGDGINDFWNINGLENQGNAKIYIFDRYGKLIKQIISSGLGWDGTYNNTSLPASDYWFTVEYIEPLTTDSKIFKSHFSLKR